MKRTPGYGETLLIVFPTVWWAVAAAASSLYLGWNHDPRFFRLYQIPLAALVWMFDSYLPAEAAAIQDCLVAVLASGVLAAILTRSSRWHQAGPLRVGCTLFGVLLPWQPFIQTLDYPEWHAVAARTLAIGYASTVVIAFVAPASRGMHGTLLGLALGCGITLSVWRLERWEWLMAGSLVASFALLAYCLVRTLLGDAACRRTKG